MPKSGARRLVIDTTVAQAAGGPTATERGSVYCSNFLGVVLRKHYEVVMTPALRAEWNNHMSSFTISWLAAMKAKGRIYAVDPPPFAKLRQDLDTLFTALVEQAGQGKNQAHVQQLQNNHTAVLKDLHLIEAALASDSTIISGDHKVRDLFAAATAEIRELRTITWVDADDPGLVTWAEGGAIREKRRSLGARAADLLE